MSALPALSMNSKRAIQAPPPPTQPSSSIAPLSLGNGNIDNSININIHQPVLPPIQINSNNIIIKNPRFASSNANTTRHSHHQHHSHQQLNNINIKIPNNNAKGGQRSARQFHNIILPPLDLNLDQISTVENSILKPQDDEDEQKANSISSEEKYLPKSYEKNAEIEENKKNSGNEVKDENDVNEGDEENDDNMSEGEKEDGKMIRNSFLLGSEPQTEIAE